MVVDFTGVPEARVCIRPGESTKYFLPDFLQGRVELSVYRKWLIEHGCSLFIRDAKMKRPCAAGSNETIYTELIHAAVQRSGKSDPFTGQELAWEIINTWDTKAPWAHDPAVMKKFAPLPTVDHKYPSAAALDFEICSLAINESKSSLTPEEFVAQCGKIVEFRKNRVSVDR